MSLNIDTSSLDFNLDGTGYSALYLTPTADQQPVSCVLPDLIPANLSLPDTVLPAPLGGCKFNFNAVFPVPPTVIPKTPIPNIPCPTGITIATDINVTATGGATSTGSIGVAQDGCNYLIGGLINIDVPVIECPTGTSFTGSASITTSGIASGGGGISIVGGPCNFALVGNIDIYVPPISISGGGGTDVTTNCNSAMHNGHTITDPSFDQVSAVNVKPAPSPCCSNASEYTNLDLCNGTLALGDDTGSNTTYAAASILITNASTGATISIDSAAIMGKAVSFQEVQVCSDGNTYSMYVLATAPF